MSWRDEPGDVPPSFNPDDHSITDYDLPYKAYNLMLDDYEPSDVDLNFVLIALCEAIGGAPEGDFDLIAGAGGHEYLAYKAATANLSSEEEGEAFKGYQEAWATTRSRNVTVRFLTMVNRSIEELVSCGLVEIVEIDGHPCYHVPGHPRLMAKLAANDDSPWGERGREVWGKRAARLGELRHMPYDEYLQTEEWATRRARHLAWARYRCQVCNAAQADGAILHVHHRSYERRGTEPASDLMTLCRDCHHFLHDNWLGRYRDGKWTTAAR